MRNCDRVSTGCENPMQTRWPRRRCSWRSIYSIRATAISLGSRCKIAARLESAVAGSELLLPVRRLARNGFEAWAEVIAHDYEGLVAQDETSLYEAGRTRWWLKVKQTG
jgi:hypothetical protein